jgi:hypothetical protein
MSVGFEPTPFYGLAPKASTLDHSVTTSASRRTVPFWIFHGYINVLARDSLMH